MSWFTAAKEHAVRTDQPSAADRTALPETSAEQSGDREVLRRRLERLPWGHPSSLASDTGDDGSTEVDGTLVEDAGDAPLALAAEDGPLQHADADADPLRAFGPASETHPDELQSALARLDAVGVDVDLRPGSMSYSPSAVAGEPGRLILDPEASYGALVHEVSHFADDEAAGFPGLRYWLEDPAVTAAGEERAYQAEIDYANSIGETGIVSRLAELRDQRISQLRGEGNG